MKKIVLFISISFVLALSCSKNSSPSPTPPQSDIHLQTGLLLYLPFKGNIADSSGNGNPTAFSIPSSLGYDEHGNANSAYDADGDGTRIFVTNNGSIKFDTAFTVSVNIMVKNVQNQAFVTMLNENTGMGVSFGFGTGLASLSNLEQSVTDSLSTCNGYNNAGNTVTDTSQFIMQPYSWYNMVTIFHKGTIQIFVNGKLVSTKTWAPTTVPICSSAKVIIGGWWNSDQRGLNGRIDEVRMYNRVLNTDELTELAKNFQ